MNVFVDGTNIKKLNGLETPVDPGAVVTIAPESGPMVEARMLHVMIRIIFSLCP